MSPAPAENTLESFKAWIQEFMAQPPEKMVEVIDADGQRKTVSNGKLLDLTPEQAARIEANPELRQYLVYRA